MALEPFAARLHFIARALRHPQNALVRILRRYFERAPGWVLLTTRGRKIGLPREVLLPCERTPDGLIMLSTYGWRSNWIRNIQHDANVTITAGGWVLSGHAELVEELERKIHLASEHPFFPAAPFCADPRSSSHTATPSPGHVPAEVGSPAPACCRSSV